MVQHLHTPPPESWVGWTPVAWLASQKFSWSRMYSFLKQKNAWDWYSNLTFSGVKKKNKNHSLSAVVSVLWRNIKDNRYTCITESLCHAAEINTTLQANYTSIFKKIIQKHSFPVLLNKLSNSWVWVQSCSFHRNLVERFVSYRLCPFQFSSVQSLSRVWLFVTPWTAARQASLSITNSRSLPKLMSIELVMPSNHLILWHPLLLPPSIFHSIRVFSNESALHIKWSKYWSFSFSISPSNEHPGLISFTMDGFYLLAVQGTLKSPFKSVHLREENNFICVLFFFLFVHNLTKIS